jgi:hypothetical protein
VVCPYYTTDDSITRYVQKIFIIRRFQFQKEMGLSFYMDQEENENLYFNKSKRLSALENKGRACTEKQKTGNLTTTRNGLF